MPPCRIRLIGQLALIEAKVDLSLVATSDVDVYATYQHPVQKEFERLLERHGFVLDPVGHEAWMPTETQYALVHPGANVRGEIADAECVLLSKALRAPVKNRNLITEYLAKGASARFLDLARRYGLDLGAFT